MVRYYHSSRRHMVFVVSASVLLLLVLSFFCRNTNITRNNLPIENLYLTLNNVVTMVSDTTWSRPTPPEPEITTVQEVHDAQPPATESQLLQVLPFPDTSTAIVSTVHRVRQRRYLQSTSPPTVQIKGELRKWHKVTLAIQGPMTQENDLTNNPFTNYRLDVTFLHSLTQTTYKVPGYYATDGDSANTGAKEGNLWHVHFAPDQVGEWTYTIDFQMGSFIAIQATGVGTPVTPAHMMTGKFNILGTDKTGRDHRGKGRLEYVGKHHFQFQETKEYFLKAGSDSPENFLAYEGFDNTPNNGNRRKSWGPHVKHYVEGTDPIWKINKGKGIIGAINYLSNQGMNAFSFLTMNVDGDDENVFPYIASTNRFRFDVSKLAQWEIVFEHADKMGMMLHFKTFEQENDQLLDGGNLGPQRKMYYRELIARFSHHLAIMWNLGEEISNTVDQIKLISNYVKFIDPYDHTVIAHTTPSGTFYSGLSGTNSFRGISIQALPSNVFTNTLTWLQVSENANHKWIVSNDEQGNARTGVLPDSVDPAHDAIRQNSLWGNIMAGGAGVEYYFGYSYENSDLSCQDYSSREKMWQQSRYALEYFRDNQIPFQSMMSSKNENTPVPVKLPATSPDWLLSLITGKLHVIYRKVGNAPDGTVTGLPEGTYDVKWYNPRTGGAQQRGSIISFYAMDSSRILSYGTPPGTPTLDWVITIRKI